MCKVSPTQVTQTSLQQSEAWFRAVADSTPAPVWMTDQSGALVFANAQFIEMTGKTAAEVSGDGWQNLIHPDDLPAVVNARAEAWANGPAPYSFLARFHRHDGAWRWMEVISRPRVDADGVFQGFAGLAVDQTEAISAKAALEASEHQLRLVTDALPVLIAFIDAAGRYGFCNAAYKSWFGLKPEQVLGRHMREVLGEAAYKTLEPSVRRVLNGEHVTFENVVPYRRGGERAVSGQYVPHIGSSGAVDGFFVLVTDNSERKLNEERQRLLLNELNHRVKNTLATVQSIVAQTLRNATTVNEAGAHIEARLIALSNAHNILTRESWTGADLVELIDQAIAPFSNADISAQRFVRHGPNLRLQPRAALALSMALHELATNAVRYGALSSEAGRVEIRWGADRDSGFGLTWREIGGPEVTTPKKRGFGSRMIERGLAQDLGGVVSLNFEPTGVVCVISAPVDQIAEKGER
jgi:PAS domain S-box-containing protein